MTILNAKDQTMIRSGATRNVLQKTDRILGQHHVKVKIEGSGVPAPAYTDGETITINAGMEPISSALVNGFTPETMGLVLYLNCHELAHVMFTPRLRSRLVDNVRKRSAFTAFNILEDQAAETRFVQMYEPARHYFTSLVTNYMMKNQQYLEANYSLVSGRLFLPKRLRDSFRDNFHKPELIPDIDRLVTKYKTLVWPDDEDEMFEVIKEFHELLRETQPSEPGTPHDQIGNGSPDSKKMRELKEDEEFVNDPPEDEEQEGSSGGEEGEEQEDQSGTSKPDASSDDDGDEASTDGESDDTDDDSSEAERDEATKGSSSSGKEDESERSKEELEKAVEDALSDAYNEALDEMEEELDNYIESVKDEESNYEVEGEVEASQHRAPKPEEILTVNRCVDEFREVEMQRAPGWNATQRSGKLDPRRYSSALRGSPYIYKRWREGVNEMLDFEVVFLLDQSGSMGRVMDPASASLWILKRTFEECNGVVTTLGFSNEMYLLSQRFHPSKHSEMPIYDSLNSTLVADALRESKRILSTSIKPLKMCVVISDGIFHDLSEARQVVNEFGNPVVFIGINHDTSTTWRGHRNVVHTQTINNPTELVDVVKNLALRLSEERLTAKGMT